MTTTTERDGRICSECGAFGDLPHEWTEGTCVLPHRYDNPAHPPPAKVGHVCKWCVDRHDDWLAEIVDLYATLGEVLEPGSIPDDTAAHKKPRKQPASPSPVRLSAWALLFGQLNAYLLVDGQLEHTGREGLPNIPELLSNWAQAAFDALGWTHTAPTTVSGCCAVLRGNREVMARLPDVDEYDTDLTWIRRSLHAAHAIQSPHPLGACLTVDCRGRVWRAKPDDDDARPKCDKCNRRYGTLDIVRLHVHERKASA